MTTVVDTGPLVALVDADNDQHAACRAWYGQVGPRHLVVPTPVIAETAFLIASHVGAPVAAAFLADLGQGLYGRVVNTTPPDLARMSELVLQYESLPLSGTDACVVALAERLDTPRVATLERRHFTVVRPRHAPAFELYP
ncbi:type II toxin-antitoxin system VapC family toxin [Streptomyces sp. NPDC094438]|uniref:type II toxin-antitoxin system VapC family toxin n=1 Tax=Streptomyces sp. NPDC094438 TaxID=3366061 RepID=UPI0037FD5958